jgi:hypothetical protein
MNMLPMMIRRVRAARSSNHTTPVVGENDDISDVARDCIALSSHGE